MAIPSFSAFHDEGINLEGLLEILSPENNLVLADDMMVSDGNGIILRVSETYEKNFGFAHDSIVGKSAFDLEADGTFTPCITAEVIRRRKKISATQTINHTHKNVMTVGIPLFDANGELKYAVCFNTVSMEQINSIQRNYLRMQDSLQHYSQEIAELRTRATSTNLLFKSAPMQRLWTLMQNTANTRANILITGETGVGKSAIAKAIHKMSNRANGPFIEVNCAVLHENLIESELFGYEKGAFTGASSSGKIGKIEASVLNQKDVAALLKKVAGGCLIIEKAGDLSRETALKLSLLLEQDTSGVLVIIEDTKHGIQKALSRDDGFAAKFSEKINIPIFTSDELVSFAKSYANELGYTIDEMGVLALYNSISNIEHADRETTLTEVKEIVDKAVAHSEKGGLKKAFSIITSRRYDEDDYIILREKDFD